MNLGIGFPESVSKTRYRGSKFSRDTGNRFLGRKTLPFVLLPIAFGLLLFQTVRLQLISGPYYRVLAEQNRIKTKVIHAPRGTIYDRKGIPLVHNIPGFRETIANCSSDSCSRIISREEVLERKAKDEEFANLEIDSLRQYTKPAVFAHVLGFISQISKKELEDATFASKGYISGDHTGRGGVEEQHEEVLRGQKGKKLIETDAIGRELRVLGKVDPVAGKDIATSLDSKLSQVAYNAMKGKTGGVIVSNPKTGEIFALLSMPSFDANLFSLGPSARASTELSRMSSGQEDLSTKTGVVEKKDEIVYKNALEVLSDDKNRPIFNRAISGTYPPGSTFKIITAAAALEKGAIDETTQIEDNGVIRIGAFSFANWFFTQYGKTEGALDVVGALKRSNDIFFYKIAETTGLENLRNIGLSFGLSKKLGIDLPNEATGLFPSDSWKRENFGEPWYIGDTYHLGIGQGFLLVTPLQMNAWTNVIANNGTLCQPTVMKTPPAGRQDSAFVPSSGRGECIILNQGFLQQKTIDLIREGMRQACDTGGTGWPLFKFKVKSEKLKVDERNFFPPDVATDSGMIHIPIACKTGTAEFGDPKDRTHAWFTSFAPIADPQISVTVLVEGGGEGSSVAGPIAKKIYEEWFGR